METIDYIIADISGDLDFMIIYKGKRKIADTEDILHIFFPLL